MPTGDRLDTAQLAAVRSGADALLVVAGPGSGKTRVLVHRIAWRAATESMQARHAVAVTFTRRAARELRTRLRRLEVDDMGPVGTFHSIALAQLQQYDADHGRAARKLLASRSALSSELSEHLRHSYGPRPPITVARALREIDWAKASDLSVAEYRRGPARRRLEPAAADAAASLFGHFERVKSRRRLLDFDDLLAECTRLMRCDEHFAAAQRWLHRHFFVDEFQDLNQLQWNLLQEWIGGNDAVRNGTADICAVGDIDQAIYGWNGADSRYIAEFDRWFEGAAVIRLELNYRSHPSLVAASRAVIAPDDDSAHDTARGSAQASARPHELGPAPTVTGFDDAQAEAAGIARWIAERRLGRVGWDAFAVLARTNAQLHDIAAELKSHGIPARLAGQRSAWLQLAEVRRLLDRYRASDAHISIVMEDLHAEALAALSDEQLRPVLERMLDLARVYVAEMAHGAGRRVHRGALREDLTAQAFVSWVELLSNSRREFTADMLDGDRLGRRFASQTGAVTLATFHTAKGLQWPHVVIAGLEDGLVPLRRHDPEERRLLYVAVSRAIRTLHLTWARNRAGHGDASGNRRPSPWLEAIAATTTEAPPLQPADAVARVAAARKTLDAVGNP
ncbi:ATP-dependent helicase [Candidatus Poriferisodalis sp.]|uniref:ATP-dependent helicase n=1 Tax=Candidatus Poriferisodalis sp. TaxID=3101277 RepID=UPI003B023823